MKLCLSLGAAEHNQAKVSRLSMEESEEEERAWSAISTAESKMQN